MFYFSSLFLFVCNFLDSRIKAKDAMKEFHAGGKLVQHRFGDVSLTAAPTIVNLFMNNMTSLGGDCLIFSQILVKFKVA